MGMYIGWFIGVVIAIIIACTTHFISDFGVLPGILIYFAIGFILPTFCATIGSIFDD